MGFGFFNNRQLAELHGRNHPDSQSPITAEDLAEFLRNPAHWRQNSAGSLLEGWALRKWMQSVYNELGIVCNVPLPPVLTSKQKISLSKFNLRVFYIPDLTENNYPPCFVRINWGSCGGVDQIKKLPLFGRWVAVEILPKSSPGDLVDPLAKGLGLPNRFNVTWNNFYSLDETGTGEYFKKISKMTGFPVHLTSLLSAERWNFLANLFLWLNDRRSESLPDLESGGVSEWVANYCEPRFRLIIGHNSLSVVEAVLPNRSWVDCSFRVIFNLE